MKVGLETKKDAEKERQIKDKMKTAGFFECYILGIGIACGGLASSLWQHVLGSGLYGGLISTLILMTGYYMLDMSLSEMVGVVPFAGGSFGYVRCSLGPTAGYLAACAEMCVYGFYTIRTIQKIAKMVTFVALTDPALEKLWAFVAYMAVLIFHLRGGGWFWNTMIGCTFFTLALLAVFFVGSWLHVDYYKYALGHNNGNVHTNNGFIGGPETFMENMYYPAWFYIGVCALPLAGARVKNESVAIPKAIMAAMTTMSMLSILVLFTVACQNPGITQAFLNQTNFVLEHGFKDSLHIPERYIPCLLLVPTYASATGFMFACKHQLSAMAESGMMPAIFKKRFGPNNIPVLAVTFCTVIQYAVFLVIDHFEGADIEMTFRFTLIAACFMYMGVMIAFIAFRTKFGNMQRQFVSPVGIPGAVLGICIFFFVLVSLVGYQHDNHAAPLAFMTFLIIMMIYYFAYVQYTQFFSKEEQDKFMKAYILNANKRKKNSRWVKFMNALLGFIDKMLCGIPSKISSKRSGSKDKTSKQHGGVTTAAAGHATTAHSKDNNENQNKKSVLPTIVPSIKVVPTVSSPPTTTANDEAAPKKKRTGSLLRSSFASGAAAVGWSGKHMEDHQSRKAFAILNDMPHGDDTDDGEEDHDGNTFSTEQEGGVDQDEIAAAKVAERLIEKLPEHFVPIAADNKLTEALQAIAKSFSTHDIEAGGADVEMVRAAENTKDGGN
jgi:ethanolamine permease